MIPPPITFTDRVRALTARSLNAVGMALHRAGIHPDTISLAGLALVLAAALIIAGGRPTLGGVMLVVALPLDALDGAVARARGDTSGFGGVLDSTLDRYADGFIFSGVGYYFASIDRLDGLALALAALVGSYAVSYVRARAGEAGRSVQIGWFSRLERSLVLSPARLIPALLIPALLIPALVLLAAGTHITGLQRVWFVYRQTERRS